MDDQVDGEVFVNVEKTYSEEETREFLTKQGCSFPDFTEYDVPSAESVAASAVFSPEFVEVENSDVSLADLTGKLVRYAKSFPIADSYDDRRAWRTRLENGDPVEKVAFTYLEKYNSLKGNNITYAILTSTLLGWAVNDKYPSIADELARIGKKYLRLMKNERGESAFERRSTRYKVALTELIRKDATAVLQQIVSVSDEEKT